MAPTSQSFKSHTHVCWPDSLPYWTAPMRFPRVLIGKGRKTRAGQSLWKTTLCFLSFQDEPISSLLTPSSLLLQSSLTPEIFPSYPVIFLWGHQHSLPMNGMIIPFPFNWSTERAGITPGPPLYPDYSSPLIRLCCAGQGCFSCSNMPSESWGGHSAACSSVHTHWPTNPFFLQCFRRAIWKPPSGNVYSLTAPGDSID